MKCKTTSLASGVLVVWNMAATAMHKSMHLHCLVLLYYSDHFGEGVSGECYNPLNPSPLPSWLLGPPLVFKNVLGVHLCYPFHTVGVGTGICITGKIESGHVQVGESVLLLPANEIISVKGTVIHQE